jgi:hypothetical protein
MPLINLHGLILDVDIEYAQQTPATEYENGYSELEWTCNSGQDEIGENISTSALDLICNEYINEIERAIWAQIEGNRS